jgi:hypothetical protein
MASISSNPETTAVCQDWMVELRSAEHRPKMAETAGVKKL